MKQVSNTSRLHPVEDESVESGGYNPEVDTGYSPFDFIIPGSDHQGHSERVYCRVQPQVARALSKVLSSRRFPFRTTGDVMRWCIARGLKVLDRLEPMPGFIGTVDTINEIMKQQLYLQELKTVFESMTQVVQQHIAAGAEGEARKMVGLVLSHIRKMEDEPYWKGRMEAEVKARFGHLLEGGGKKVSLRSKVEDGEGE